MPSTTSNRLAMPRVVQVLRLFYVQRYSEKFHADENNELLHIIDGSMKLVLEDGKEYSAGKQDTLFIPRGVRHKDIFDVKNGVEVFHLSFKWQDDSRFFSAASPDCLYSLPSKEKNELLLLFDSDVNVANAGMPKLMFLCWGYIIFSVTQVYASGLKGLRKATTALFCTLGGVIVPRLFWVWLVIPRMHTPAMLYLIYPISWTISAVVLVAVKAVMVVR